MYSFLPFLMAAPQSGAEGGPGLLASLIPFILVIFIFYFLIIRPQNKKRKETEKMLGALKRGDKIVTIGGLYGTIQTVKEKEGTVIIKVDDNVKLEFLRSAISNVVTQNDEKPDKNSKNENLIENKTEQDTTDSGE